MTLWYNIKFTFGLCPSFWYKTPLKPLLSWMVGWGMALEGCSGWPQEGPADHQGYGSLWTGQTSPCQEHAEPTSGSPKPSPGISWCWWARQSNNACWSTRAILSVCVTCCHSSFTVPDQTGGAPAANEWAACKSLWAVRCHSKRTGRDQPEACGWEQSLTAKNPKVKSVTEGNLQRSYLV